MDKNKKVKQSVWPRQEKIKETEREAPSLALGICQFQLSYFYMSRKRKYVSRDVRKVVDENEFQKQGD